jgi:RimJ/RimL family protein N-acetyltransferase
MSANSGEVTVRMLGRSDAEALVALRRRALDEHPLAFAASPEDDRGLSVELTRSSLDEGGDSAVFGAFDATGLVGMVGVVRMTKVKMRHNALVWGMYVAGEVRGRGVGADLLRAAVARCRAWPGLLQVHLAVSETAHEASRLYERFGFVEWGREPRALAWGGRHYDERHLVLALDR